MWLKFRFIPNMNRQLSVFPQKCFKHSSPEMWNYTWRELSSCIKYKPFCFIHVAIVFWSCWVLGVCQMDPFWDLANTGYVEFEDLAVYPAGRVLKNHGTQLHCRKSVNQCFWSLQKLLFNLALLNECAILMRSIFSSHKEYCRVCWRHHMMSFEKYSSGFF